MLFWISVILLSATLVSFDVLLGFWVYTDAKSRNEKPLTWALIAALVPNLFGLLIYFLVGRKNNSKIGNKFKLPLIAFAVAAVLSAGLFIGDVVLSNNLPIMSGVSIGMVEDNIGNHWNVSFKTSGETLTRTVNLSNVQMNNFYVYGKCDSGRIYLLILQGEQARVINLTNLPEQKLVLSKFQSGNIELQLYNSNARNAQVKISWDK